MTVTVSFTMTAYYNVQQLAYRTVSISPFYIYICVSQRFQLQLVHVHTNAYRNQWFCKRKCGDQVRPQV
ncbi:unnamed protein product [Adineta ricciae]|uniref:Uncharacterized protein n=1 Tax=Adineta ricciae TaxID=249248 RepID=A0A814PH61_ADIRI|nr:unnamed protein product [Adineta ricciae]